MADFATPVDSSHELRREINALHGLLMFSQERRYPEGVTSSLKHMLNSLEHRLSSSEQQVEALRA